MPWVEVAAEWLKRAARAGPAAAPLRGHPARLDRLPPGLPSDGRRAAAVRGARGRRLPRDPGDVARRPRARAARRPLVQRRRPRPSASPRTTRRRRRRLAGGARPGARRWPCGPFLERCADDRAAARGLQHVDAPALPALRRRAGVRACSRRPATALLICGRCTAAGASTATPARSAATTTAACCHSFTSRDAPLPPLRLRRVPALHQGVRRPARRPAGHAGAGLDGDAAAGRGSHAEGVSGVDDAECRVQSAECRCRGAERRNARAR